MNDQHKLFRSAEDERARVLSHHLFKRNLVDRDDVIIADGFWCGDLAMFGCRRVISVAHGIWGHVTHDDVLAGRAPENPQLHSAQIIHRLAHRSRGLPIVAVSHFIADQMRLQWGIESTVINNAVDPAEIVATDYAKEWVEQKFAGKFLIIHGVNDLSNLNKGGEHLKAVEGTLNMETFDGISHIKIMSLDRCVDGVTGDVLDFKNAVLQRANAAVIPSNFEGNSYFFLELLTSGKPIVAYDVGLAYAIKQEGFAPTVGELIDRRERNPMRTAEGARSLLKRICEKDRVLDPGRYIERVSFERFKSQWIYLVDQLCRTAVDVYHLRTT
jgi:glycosyltransferase involved in cell wall biosynthesis